MPSTAPEYELGAALYSILSGDTTLVNSTAIDPQTGSNRALAVVNQVAQDQAVPYIRVTLTDTAPVENDAEPFDYSYVPNSKLISGLIDIFDDSEPSVWAIAARVQVLLQHTQITTTTYNGSTWFKQVVFFADDVSNPDKIYRRGSLRIRVNIEKT